MSIRSEITRLLERVEDDPLATEQLFPLVYDELRRMAQVRMDGEPVDHTLVATALVHEAYLRLVVDPDMRWENRAHFFGAAARAMRRILVERARRYQALKRKGKKVDISPDALPDLSPEGAGAVLALDRALAHLEEHDPDASRIVSLRHFAGLSVADTAQALGLSGTTVKRRWAFAKAWLYLEIRKLQSLDD